MKLRECHDRYACHVAWIRPEWAMPYPTTESQGGFYNGKWIVVYNNSQRAAVDRFGCWHPIVFIAVLGEKMVGGQAHGKSR
ncbi:MAG: hypothetical protein JAY84_16385 [Candidatus Thiodiazotropha taylori]|nr:hypothetical protein [Candidatus Thiodiazotropha taylori]